jgi:16S rRNA (cytosine967-C5)-methyltransferase
LEKISKNRVPAPIATRAVAAAAVDLVLRKGRVLDRALQEVVKQAASARDLAQIKALAFGALRWHHRHRLIIAELLERPLRSRDKVLEALLSVGLFQLLNPRQPAYAAVSETVQASRDLGRPRAAGLINASLRRFLRERSALLDRVMDVDEGRYAHPQWLIDRLRRDWPTQWEIILDAALAHPPLWIRVNRQRTSRDAYASRLRDERQIESHVLPGFPDALRLETPLTINELPGFAEGLVSVQDAAPQLAADLLAPEPNMRVLDACAAPGGKTCHLLERAGGRLELVAIDVDSERNALLEQNLQRLGYSARVFAGDCLCMDQWADEQLFDRIMLDAPCSATGVIRRHPDIKFLRRAGDIPALAQRQQLMLEKLWSVLKPGGRLLYATCSVLMEENVDVVSEFLSRHADGREIRLLHGPVLESVIDWPGPGYQLLPGPADTDGFYYALIERLAS